MCILLVLITNAQDIPNFDIRRDITVVICTSSGCRYKRAKGEGPPLKYEWNYMLKIRSQFQSYILAVGWTSSVPSERYSYRVTCYDGDYMFAEVPTGFHVVCEHPVAITRMVEWFLCAISMPTKTTHNIPAGRLFQGTVLSSVTLYSLERLRLFSLYSRFSANSVLVSHGRHKLMLCQFDPLAQYRVLYFARRASKYGYQEFWKINLLMFSL